MIDSMQCSASDHFSFSRKKMASIAIITESFELLISHITFHFNSAIKDMERLDNMTHNSHEKTG